MTTSEVSDREVVTISVRPRILIVEDEPVVAEDIREELESCGYEVIGVTGSGRLAIEIAKGIRPDIVMMDYRINSDLDGIETAVCLQSLFERPVPIVFATAYSIEDRAVLAAVNPYTIVKKPFSGEDLTAKILELMSPTPL